MSTGSDNGEGIVPLVCTISQGCRAEAACGRVGRAIMGQKERMSPASSGSMAQGGDREAVGGPEG